MKLESRLISDTLMFEELKLKHYKDLLKCLYGDTPDKKTFVTTIIEISSAITNKPVDFFKQLNIVEFAMFLLDLRMSVLGPSGGIVVTRNDKQMNLEIDLTNFKQDLKEAYNTVLKTTIAYEDKIFVDLECPSFERLLDEEEKDEYIKYIKKIVIKTKSEQIEILVKTNKQARELFYQLMPKLSLQVINFCENVVKTGTKANLLARYKLLDNQQILFLPSLDILIWILKLFFNESLSVIYENLFYLSYSGKLDLSYVENCTVGEYTFFVNTLRNVLSKQSSTSNQQFSETPEDPLSEESVDSQ